MSMDVRELIELLRQYPPEAVVVIGDPEDGGVGKVHAGDIREVRLRFGEANGVGWYELIEGDAPFDVPGVWIA